MFRYHIKPDSDTPIYRQLVDQINAEIRSGVLKNGTQLPTVREMAQLTGLSCGTIKRVYDCLQEMGDIEMTRRRGTFVKYVSVGRDSRKIQAMNAIDRMMRQLTELNFSPAEIQIFINLKMREWGLKWSGVRIAVAENCAECAAGIEEQLRQIGNITVSIWPLSQIREYPYGVDEQSDVILTSPENHQVLQSLLPDDEKLISVAMEPDRNFLFAVAAAREQRIGILCADASFADVVKNALPEGMRHAISVCTTDGDADAFLGQIDCLIVSDDYEKSMPESLKEKIGTFGNVIRFKYLIDRGSMLYLQERIGRIRDERQMRPGSFSF